MYSHCLLVVFESLFLFLLQIVHWTDALEDRRASNRFFFYIFLDFCSWFKVLIRFFVLVKFAMHYTNVGEDVNYLYLCIFCIFLVDLQCISIKFEWLLESLIISVHISNTAENLGKLRRITSVIFLRSTQTSLIIY
jgi:hypothetical protein